MMTLDRGRPAPVDSLRSWIAAPRVWRPQIIASSQPLGWRGFDLQIGINDGCDLEDILIDGHYVGIQLNDAPITLRTRIGEDWVQLVNPPNAIWIQPKGTPFSARHSEKSRWAGIVIKPDRFDSALGQHRELHAGYQVADGLLTHLLFSLINQISDTDPAVVHNGALSEALIRSFLLALGQRHTTPLPQKGGIAPHQLKLLRKWMEARLAGDLSVALMAEYLGYSEAHFSREFKRSVGMTPWDYVIQMRAQTAYAMLQTGERPCNVALRCGFSDQAHLSRVLKARLGTSPSQIMRAQRITQKDQ